jgi:PleD family two-component response regulator
MSAFVRPRLTNAKYRLLYLGNDLKLIAVLRQLLTEPDYYLVACSDSEGPVLFLGSEIQYHLLLIDLDWRGVEGLELAQLAQSLEHRKQMPIVLVTPTELNSEMEALARKAGVTECVMKTPDMLAVSEAIRRLLEDSND